MKIDQQLFAVIDYCKSAAVPIIYVVPELQISSQTKTKEAVSIRTAKELTFITGSTDYGILAIPGIQASQPVCKSSVKLVVSILHHTDIWSSPNNAHKKCSRQRRFIYRLPRKTSSGHRSQKERQSGGVHPPSRRPVLGHVRCLELRLLVCQSTI